VFNGHASIESRADVQVGCEVDGDVFVRGGEQAADAQSPGESRQVVSEHLGERTIQGGGELVGDEPGRSGQWTVDSGQ
jgi:hypothetical protein